MIVTRDPFNCFVMANQKVFFILVYKNEILHYVSFSSLTCNLFLNKIYLF